MSKAVLLVQNSRNDLLFMALALRQVGCINRVIATQDSAEAIRRLRLTSTPAVALVEVTSHTAGAFEILRWIREHQRTEAMPVLLLVTSPDALRSEIRQGYRLGATACLTKPSDFEGFLTIARCMKSRWLDDAQPPLDPEPWSELLIPQPQPR